MRRHKKKTACMMQTVENGGQTWNRTRDTRIFSPLLYQLSYLAAKCFAQGRVLERVRAHSSSRGGRFGWFEARWRRRTIAEKELFHLAD